MVWVIALSFGFYGIKVGLAGRALARAQCRSCRGPGGMLEDNNDFSLALCMGAAAALIHIGASGDATSTCGAASGSRCR